MSFSSNDLFTNTLDDAFNSSSILNLSSSFTGVNSDEHSEIEDSQVGACLTPEPIDERVENSNADLSDKESSQDSTFTELTTLTNVTTSTTITTSAPLLQSIPTNLHRLQPLPQTVQSLPSSGLGIPIVINNIDGTPMGTVSVLPANSSGNFGITNTNNGPVLQIGSIQLTQEDITVIQQQLQAKFFQQQAALGIPQLQQVTQAANSLTEPYYVVFNAERYQAPLVTSANPMGFSPSTPTIPILKSAPTVTQPVSNSSIETPESTVVNRNSDSSSPETNVTGRTIIPPHMTMHLTKEPMPPEDLCDLEDLERFAKKFKERRVELGFTQGDVGSSIGHSYPNDFSQTTISRFEAMNLSLKNMNKLRPLLEKWLESHSENDSCLSSNFGRVVEVELNSIEGAASRKRKRRTTIDNNIKEILEKKFKVKSKPAPEELHKIAEELDIEKGVVRVWFCNRRQKEKKTGIYYNKWLNTG